MTRFIARADAAPGSARLSAFGVAIDAAGTAGDARASFGQTLEQSSCRT
jgi:hypothetical protein